VTLPLFSDIATGKVSDEFRHHRIHAALTRGNSIDIGSYRIRIEGAASPEKTAMAYRLAFAWNMAEGIPLVALEKGAVRAFHEAADALLAAVLAGQDPAASAERLRDADAALMLDTTDDRLHDCHHCGASASGPAGESLSDVPSSGK
jgi:hypothetical protein